MHILRKLCAKIVCPCLLTKEFCGGGFYPLCLWQISLILFTKAGLFFRPWPWIAQLQNSLTMKLAFISPILDLPTKASGAFKLLLFLAACLAAAENYSPPNLKNVRATLTSTSEETNVSNTLAKAMVACSVSDITLLNLMCSNNGTSNNFLDDFYTVKVKVTYTEKTGGVLYIEPPLI